MERELTPAAFRNLLNAVRNAGNRVEDIARTGLTDRLDGEIRGEYTLELLDPETGAVVEQREVNSVVDEGRNAVLQFVGGIADTTTVTFSGDGSTTQFDIPHPYHPIKTVNSVTVGGTGQSVPGDYAVDYFAGTLYFDSAPASGTDNVAVDVDYLTHPWRWLAVGTDGSSVTDSQTSLQAEASRTPTDSGYYTRNESGVEITGQWTFGGSQANVTIREAGLFNVPSSAAVNGDMLNRAVVSPAIDKASGQDLRVTWTLTM